MCALSVTAVPNLEAILSAHVVSPIGDGAMTVEEVTLAIFAVCISIRVAAYVPQILKAGNDKNGASSISFMTWSLFLLTHVSTVAYALVNRSAWDPASFFASDAICCVCHSGSRYWKWRHARWLCWTDRPALCVAV